MIRKVVQYSLARPTREMLFTVLSREEKYSAKITLDTVVQRVGDAAAAALFEVVGELANFQFSTFVDRFLHTPTCLVHYMAQYG